MDVSTLAAQQVVAQNKMTMSMVKQSAKAEQALVNMIQQAASSSGRGQNLNITV